jgi:putative aldouronate transport system permease protein
MLVTVLAAYPISKRRNVFRSRDFYAWYIVITMLFSGGLIPWYLVIRYTGLIDTIWALIIPYAVPAFNVIILQNFFKELPDEISESAHIDGAGHWTLLFKIMMPLSKPVIATLILFVAVGHWNSWFDGMLLMNRPENYPLQTYLQTIVVQINVNAINNVETIKNICQRNSQAAQIIIAMLPILCVYPFLQKYFTKGIILGSVKG